MSAFLSMNRQSGAMAALEELGLKTASLAGDTARAVRAVGGAGNLARETATAAEIAQAARGVRPPPTPLFRGPTGPSPFSGEVGSAMALPATRPAVGASGLDPAYETLLRNMGTRDAGAVAHAGRLSPDISAAISGSRGGTLNLTPSQMGELGDAYHRLALSRRS